MKALETIKDHTKDLERMEGVFTFYGCFNSASECKKANKELTEAIAELEALQQHKSCDNCEYESGDNFKTLIECGTDIHICALCKRGTNDYFKLKEQ